MYKKLIKSLFVFICLFLLTPECIYAATLKKIVVEGNQRVERETIISYLAFPENGDYDQDLLDESLKKLHNTGLFSNVDFDLRDNILHIKVSENPFINKIGFEGNKRVKTEDLKNETILKARTVFTQTKLKNDISRILDIYSKEGRFAAKVEPKIIELEDNRINIVFEINEGDKTPIKAISFIGNEIYSDHKLRSVVVSKETAWYRFISGGDHYDADRIEYDKELLRKFYNSMGFADFKVISSIASLSEDKDAFYLTFAVEEGRKYRVGESTILSQIPAVKVEELEKEIRGSKGDIYNADLIEKTINNMTQILTDQGYAFVDIEPVYTRHNGEDNIIDVQYKIAEGSKVYINRININGNVRTLDKVIRREFRLSEGDPFNSSKLRRSEQRIRDLDYFDKVEITTVRTNDPDKVDIEVMVEEKTTGDLNFGGGYSTTDGILGRIGMKEKNLIGTGQEVSVTYERSERKSNFEFSFTEPYFMDKELSMGFDLFNIGQDNHNISSYSTETNGGKVRAGYEITEYLTHGVFYSLKETDINNVKDYTSSSIKAQAGKTVSSGVGHGLHYDKRNSRIFPTDGYYVGLDQEVTGLGGDSRFLRNEVKASYYYPVMQDSDVVLKFGVSAGHIFGSSNKSKGKGIHIFERFFVGGDDLRGFRTAGIGPRDNTNNLDSLGGNTFYLGNVELHFPLGLPEEFDVSGATFIDAGNLFGIDVPTATTVGGHGKTRVSAGVGMVWITRMGPFRLDWARPLVKEDYDRAQSLRFSFSTGF